MKIKHNKKRNTAFVYEALVRESTVALLRSDTKRQQTVIKIIKKHFGGASVLRKDLDCYRSLYENQNFDLITSEKVLKESKLQRRLLAPDVLFSQQSDLIHDVNKTLSPTIFDNFVPNYKTLATIAQIFGDNTSPKNRVILEIQILSGMRAPPEEIKFEEKIDDVVYRSFVKKFNKKYDGELLEEQKQLLSHYISSFADNALELKVFLNEEIGRLKEVIRKAQNNEHISADDEMSTKTQQIIAKLESYATQGMDENVLTTILKTQKLAKELTTDGGNN
jgi:hypothetical protein